MTTKKKKVEEGTISSTLSSSKETAAKLKSLLKEIPTRDDSRADATRLDEVRRVLAGLVQQGDLVFSNNTQNQETVQAQWNAWLQKQHKIAVQQLVVRIRKFGRRTAVRTLWGLVAASPQQVGNGSHLYFVHSELLFQWFSALVNMPNNIDATTDKPLHHLLQAELGQRDVQYYTLKVITRWANECYKTDNDRKQGGDSENYEEKEEKDGVVTRQEQADRMLNILMMIPFPKTQEALNHSSSQQNNKYLFPPPKSNNNNKHEKKRYEDQDEEDSSSEDDSDDENSSDDDDDDDSEEAEQPHHKKQKTQTTTKSNRGCCFAYQDVNCHLKALEKAWMAIFRMPLSTAALKKALPFLSNHILPTIRHPLRFADLFMQAYSGASGSGSSSDHEAHSKSVIPLLALDGLFYLMMEHRLEYPQFYTQLYALLKPKLFYVKYRARFFALLQKCLLRNEMLPAHVVAAFVKRLLQCALKAPPSGALFVLALTSNLLRQHEECSALIHRSNELLEEDEYNPETNNPAESNALRSSLWEVAALEKHYHPAVSTLAKSIGREDPKSPMFQLDEMADHTYDSLLEQERKRKAGNKKRKHTYDKDAKALTPVTFVPPKGLFSPSDVFAGILSVAGSDNDAV